jgi:predicted AAA+ superfamily ATPase
VYYWKERDHEVDFILERKGKLVAIEVKSNDTAYTKGLSLFRQRYPQAKIVLIGKSGIPWQEMLSIDPVELF